MFLLDQHLTIATVHIFKHSQFWDVFFSFFSQRGFALGVWVVVLLPFLILEEKKDKKFLLYSIVVLVISILSTFILKSTFKRERPLQTIPKKQIHNIVITSACPTDYSFPSGHTLIAFSFAVLFSYFDKKRRLLYYSTAVLIGLSRIYLQCHFILDVLAGALIGITLSVAVIKLSLTKEEKKV